MQAWLALSRDERNRWLADQGEPTLRAKQIQSWILQRRADSFAAMTDLPLELRQTLSDTFTLFSTRLDKALRATDGTNKLLLRLHDEQLIECVLLHEDGRHTACISTQVGCGMGCVFCASGLNGVERNLTSAEIVEQLVRLRNLLSPEERLTHIVVMGMGEPLANLDNLLEALTLATSKDGLGIGARHITISTVGLPAKMKRLADLKMQYHLAVSLHAPNDDLRSQIVPTNDKTGLDAILDAADYFQAQTHRQVTYEYVLLRGLNDRPEQAEELGRLLKGRQAHVNLIPFNDVAGLPFRRPAPESVADFGARLQRQGIAVHVRKRKGSDIDAACGQLRRSALSPEPAARIDLQLPTLSRE